MRRSAQAGQAFVLMLVLAVLLMAGSVAVFALGSAHLAAARAQTAADLTALSLARALRTELPALAVAGSDEGTRLRARLERLGRQVAGEMDAQVVEMVVADEPWPPQRAEVLIERSGPRGTRARARARAGIVLAVAGPSEERTGWATGGGYSGPLVYRDGKPMCPAVAGAFDLMDAAANSQGIDLVVNSGFRSDAEQAVLFARHPDPKWVAPPGRSRHRDATELDINMGDGGRAHAWLRSNAGRFGFIQRYSWEPWHWGYVPGCGADSSTAGGERSAALALPAWVPGRYAAGITAAALANGLPPALLAALLKAESDFRPDAVSHAGAQGIAQFMPATARGMGLRDPFDPTQAIPAAARLLAGHQRDFGSVALALAAYNAGPGAVRRYGGVPPYAETQAYVLKVMALAGGSAALTGPGGDGVTLLPIDR